MEGSQGVWSGVWKKSVLRKLLLAGVPWTSPKGPPVLAFLLCEMGLMTAGLPSGRAGGPGARRWDVLFKPGPRSHRSWHVR